MAIAFMSENEPLYSNCSPPRFLHMMTWSLKTKRMRRRLFLKLGRDVRWSISVTPALQMSLRWGIASLCERERGGRRGGGSERVSEECVCV